jgi:hypothetical protein
LKDFGGGFFLRKKPLSELPSVYSNSENAITAASDRLIRFLFHRQQPIFPFFTVSAGQTQSQSTGNLNGNGSQVLRGRSDALHEQNR